MKINIQEWDVCKEIEVSILCRKRDKQVDSIVKYLQGDNRLCVRKDQQTILLPQEEILYIEAVDQKTFVYGKEFIYECETRLYLLEEILEERYFFRISKSTIVNVSHIAGLEPEDGRRLKLELNNQERLIVCKKEYLSFLQAYQEQLKED